MIVSTGRLWQWMELCSKSGIKDVEKRIWSEHSCPPHIHWQSFTPNVCISCTTQLCKLGKSYNFYKTMPTSTPKHILALEFGLLHSSSPGVIKLETRENWENVYILCFYVNSKDCLKKKDIENISKAQKGKPSLNKIYIYIFVQLAPIYLHMLFKIAEFVCCYVGAMSHPFSLGDFQNGMFYIMCAFRFFKILPVAIT